MTDEAEPIWETNFSNGRSEYYVGITYPNAGKGSVEEREKIGKVVRGISSGVLFEREKLPEYFFISEEFEKLPKSGVPDFLGSIFSNSIRKSERAFREL